MFIASTIISFDCTGGTGYTIVDPADIPGSIKTVLNNSYKIMAHFPDLIIKKQFTTDSVFGFSVNGKIHILPKSFLFFFELFTDKPQRGVSQRIFFDFLKKEIQRNANYFQELPDIIDAVKIDRIILGGLSNKKSNNNILEAFDNKNKIDFVVKAIEINNQKENNEPIRNDNFETKMGQLYSANKGKTEYIDELYCGLKFKNKEGKEKLAILEQIRFIPKEVFLHMLIYSFELMGAGLKKDFSKVSEAASNELQRLSKLQVLGNK